MKIPLTSFFRLFCFQSTDNLEHFDAHDHEASIPYDEQLLNKIQFSSLLISFVGVNKNEMVISALIDFFRSHYQETAEEKNEKKTQVCPFDRHDCETSLKKSCFSYINDRSMLNGVLNVISSSRKSMPHARV